MHIVLLQFYLGRPTPAYQKIASALRERGHKVWTAARNKSGDLVWHDIDRVITMQHGPPRLPDRLRRLWLIAVLWKRFSFFCFMLRVRSFLKQIKPNIVQVNPMLCSWVLPFFMPSQIRFILDVRQAGEVGSKYLIHKFRDWRAVTRWKFYSRFIYHHTCFLHALAATRVLGKKWTQVASVIPIGVDVRFLNHSQNFNFSRDQSNPVRFIYIGTLSKLRQLEKILFAVQWILDRSKEFQVVLLGSDAAQGFYHSLVYELQLDSVITIESPKRYEDLPQVLSGFDVALAYVPNVPAWQYQPTLKVLEYRAVGLPIIATDIKPNREIIEHGVNGLLVQNSIECFAEGMLRFVEDRNFLKHCKMNAQKMRRGVTWSEVAKMYEQKAYC